MIHAGEILSGVILAVIIFLMGAQDWQDREQNGEEK
jgi:hypothetical protein